MPTDTGQPIPTSPENSSHKNPTMNPEARQPTDNVNQEKAEKKIEREDKTRPPRWQERLLPLMAGLLIGLTFFFFLATFIQISYLHISILNSPTIDINPDADIELATSTKTFHDRMEARRLEVLTRMEAYLVEKRYHHASVLIMSGLWVRYLGFVTGMILALVGASFVLGKLREPVSEFAGKVADSVNLSLRSASPGIILVVLGVMLMFTTIIDRDYYEVNDIPVYLNVVPTPFIPTEVPVEDMRSYDEFIPTYTSPDGTPTPQSP